jgi:predicted DNA-binding transcriptional regulator YafY
MPEARRRERQIVRVLGLLGSLLEGGRPSVRELAARFKTRRETIYRDLRVLEDAGYPIAGDERGCMSRPRLAQNPRQTRPEIRLNDQELNALLWASVHARGIGQPFGKDLISAVVKLRAMQSVRRDPSGDAIENAVSIISRGQKDYSPHRETVLKLVEGILRRRSTRVCYSSPNRPEPHEFDFDPYRLLFVPDGLYCVGQNPDYGGVITLAIDRIRSVSLLPDTFEVDPSFDPEKITQDAFGLVWEDPMTVVVRFREDQAPYVKERTWHPSQSFRDLPDGGVEMTFRAAGEFEITRWILGWGDAAEVVEPEELRKHIARALDQTLAHYGASIKSSPDVLVVCGKQINDYPARREHA